MNRAVGFYLQKNGVNIIPNVRWSDKSSFEYCFLGIPKNSVVSISTHGCIRSKKQRETFKVGLDAMLEELKPVKVLVHGHMPDEVFKDFLGKTEFYRYPSEFEATHKKVVD